jgi:DNA polymerase/3'-5' exonuclease PolX
MGKFDSNTNNGADTDAAPDWARIAPLLREMANLSDQQERDGYRAMAYRRAADYLERVHPDLRTLRHEGGRDARGPVNATEVTAWVPKTGAI